MWSPDELVIASGTGESWGWSGAGFGSNITGAGLNGGQGIAFSNALTYKFTGVARDRWNSPLAGATLRLFRTSDNTWLDSATSASDGTFTMYSQFSGNHYILGYKAGAPIDVEGGTANTLVGV
jgi:hypothetical protein